MRQKVLPLTAAGVYSVGKVKERTMPVVLEIKGQERASHTGQAGEAGEARQKAGVTSKRERTMGKKRKKERGDRVASEAARPIRGTEGSVNAT